MIALLAATAFASSTVFQAPTNALQPQRIVLNLVWGTVSVYVPNDLKPGAQISGSVFASPAGRTYPEQHANLEFLESLKLRIGASATPIGRTMFTTALPSVGAVPVDVEDSAGKLYGNVTIPFSSRPGGEVHGLSAPRIVQTQMPFCVQGAFSGDRNSAFASVNGRPVGVLAESQSECCLSWTSDQTGPVKLHLRQDGQTLDQKVNVVRFVFLTPAKPVKVRTKTSVGVEVDGLQDVEPSAFPILVNLFIDHPEVMRFDGPNAAVYTLRLEAADLTGGRALKSVPIIAKGKGTYSITGSIADSSGLR